MTTDEQEYLLDVSCRYINAVKGIESGAAPNTDENWNRYKAVRKKMGDAAHRPPGEVIDDYWEWMKAYVLVRDLLPIARALKWVW